MIHNQDPREFSSFDDYPTNTGWFGQDLDWDEVRPRSLRWNDDEVDEDDEDIDEPDNFGQEGF